MPREEAATAADFFTGAAAFFAGGAFFEGFLAGTFGGAPFFGGAAIAPFFVAAFFVAGFDFLVAMGPCDAATERSSRRSYRHVEHETVPRWRGALHVGRCNKL